MLLRSSRGSAVVEFLLVSLPMLAITSSTIGLSWFAFEKVSLRVLSMESAWRFSQPDFEQAALHEYLAEKLLGQTGMNRFSLDATTDWSYGNSFSLSVYPAEFPYDEAIKYVNKFAETATLLTDAGLARNYYNAQSYIEKYATLMLALANPDKNNPKVVSDCK